MFWFSQVSNIASTNAHTQRWVAGAFFFVTSLISAYALIILNDKAALLYPPRMSHKPEDNSGIFSPENYFTPL